MEKRITEQPSHFRDLEKKGIKEITKIINDEDKKVAIAVEKALNQINKLIDYAVRTIKNGGRFFYVGAGSGGRLSVLDVIELPTTYGVSSNLFFSLLAGGKEHLIEAREEAEDDEKAGWNSLKEHNVTSKDFVVGISASGTTPYVLETLKVCQNNKITTGCIVNNPHSIIADYATFPIEVITGPEVVTGSTRMKCGTSQKMIFDMISTTTMIKLERVKDNRMIHAKLINEKIIDRSVKIIMEFSKLEYDEAKSQLLLHGSVANVLNK